VCPQARMPVLLHEFNWKKEALQATEQVLVDLQASWCPPFRNWVMAPLTELFGSPVIGWRIRIRTDRKKSKGSGS
jgi:hypothetical protein